MEVTIVAAVADNGVIGDDGELPWHHPEDLRHFKRTTVGHPVVVGRRTYESIVDRLGGPLPDRLNVVLSSRTLDLPDGTVRAGSVEEALAVVGDHDDEVYVVGGAAVYEQLLDRADRLVLTEIHATHEGNVRFPEWNREEWVEVDRDDREALSFVTYERR